MYKVKNINKEKGIKYCLILYSLLLFVFQLKNVITTCLKPTLHLSSYYISDWLINYEGGFVRRGLIGQGLYIIYKYTHINVIYIIIFLSFLILILFSWLFYKKWRQYKLSIILLPTFVILGGFWNGSQNYLGFRRDILIFLFIWFVFFCYQKVYNHQKKYLIPFHIVSIITILSHEASFFYMTPIIGLHFFLSILHKHSYKKSILNTFFLLLPSIVTFLLCCEFKGNISVANIIWNSWQLLFISMGAYHIPLGLGPAALAWTTEFTAFRQLNRNFLTNVEYIHLPSILLWPFIFLWIFYLLININKYSFGIKNNQQSFSLIKYIHILLIQCIFMLPMFTILSCDYCRLFLYCIISSFLFYFTLPSKSLCVFYNRKISLKIKRWCLFFQTGIFSKKWFYLIILLCAGTPNYIFNINDIINSSMLGQFKDLYLLILKII